MCVLIGMSGSIVTIVLPCPEKQKGNVPSSKRAENFKKSKADSMKRDIRPLDERNTVSIAKMNQT